jgi:spore coat protein H
MIGIYLIFVSDTPLLVNLPSDEDIQEYIDQEEARQDEIDAAIEAFQDDVDRLENLYLNLDQELTDYYDSLTLAEQVEYDAFLEKQASFERLFDYNLEHTFIVDYTEESYQELIEHMEDYNQIYGTYKSNHYVNVDVTYIEDGTILSIPDVGLRSKGNIYSRTLPIDGNGNYQPIHFVLKFNETFDYMYGTTAYQALKEREVFNLEKLIFKWNRNWDQTNMNEVYAYEMFRLGGVILPHANVTEVIIRIDGEVVESNLYTVIESYDEEFVRKSFEDPLEKDQGNLYKAIWGGTIEELSYSDIDTGRLGIREWETNYRPEIGLETNDDVPFYGDIITFSQYLNSENLYERKAYIDQYMDVDSWMRAMAMNVLLGNPDDYRGNANNSYYYFDLDGVFHYVPFDYDHSLGTGWDGSPQFINYTIGNDIYDWGYPSGNPHSIPLWDHVIVFDDYKELYEQYLFEFIDSGLFSSETYQSYYNVFESIYGDRYNFNYDKQWYFDGKIEAVLDDLNK